MNSRVLQLNADELTSVWSAIDPLHVLLEVIADPSTDRVPAGRFHPWPSGKDLVLLEDLRAGRRCVLPVATLTAFHTAALVTVAARALVAPGVVTAAVFGSGSTLQVLLALLTRHVPGISHIAVCPSGGPGGPLDPAVVDQLHRAGVGWSVTDVPADAALGATLVVALTPHPALVELGPPVAGALLVGTGGSDFSDDVLDAVSQTYVDDLTLNRARGNGRRNRRVEADLGRVLRGAHPGRTHVDDVLLVELLDANRLDVHLAVELHHAALVRELGVYLDE